MLNLKRIRLEYILNKIQTIRHHRFPAADGIRGMAVLIVLLAHCIGMFFPAIGAKTPGAGKIGVWLFFVLSSFLLTRNFISDGFKFKTIQSYILGRFIRIIPLYIIALIVYYSFGYFPLQYAINLLTLNIPWGHLWTVAVEFKFYIILPFIALALIKSKSKFGNGTMIAISMLIIILQQWVYPYYDVKSSSTDMTGYISAFIPGMACAVLFSHHKQKAIIADLVCIFMFIGVIISIPGVRQVAFGVPVDNYLLDKHVHFAFVWSVFVFFALSSTGKINALFCSPVLRLLGKWSFSIYLFHWLIYTQIMKNHMNSHAWSTLAFFMAIGIGGTVYYLIERPIEKTRHLLMKIV